MPVENRLGEEGQGLKIALSALDGGRIGIAAQAVGLAQGALEETIKYAKQRKAFGRNLGDFQAIQWMIADMASELDAAELLVMDAASRAGRGEPYGPAASMAKLYASEAASRAANHAVQIHGGYGFIKDYPVERIYRDVKLCEIGEGTSEVQRMIIARHALA